MPSFDDYKKLCGEFFTQKKVEKPAVFASSLLTSAKTEDDKINLVTAMEYWHYDFVKQHNVIIALEKKRDLIKKIEKLADFFRITDQDIQNLVDYQTIIKAKIDTMREKPNYNKDVYQKLRVLSDCCLMLIALYRMKPQSFENSKSISTWIKDDDVFRLCKQALYQPLSAISLKEVQHVIKKSTKEVLKKKKIKVSIAESEVMLSDAQTRNQMLRNALNELLTVAKENSWKHRFLFKKQLRIFKLRGAKGVEIETDFAFEKSCTRERFFVQKHDSKGACVSLGSTYFNSTYNAGKTKSLLLDANYGCFSESDNDTGATSDGYGHLPNADANKQIQLTAFWTAKQAFRRVHSYQDPQALFKDFPSILANVGNDVRNIGIKVEDFSGASCVVTKIFKSPGNSIIFCGAVGDSLALVWTGKELMQLNSPRNYPRMMSQFTPRSVTEKLSDEQIDRRLVEVPPSSIILRMTDGVWQMLPYERVIVCKADSKTIEYIEYRLDLKKLTELFLRFSVENPEATADDYHQWLQGNVVDEVNQRKKFLLDLQVQMKVVASQFKKEDSLQKIVNTGGGNNDELKNRLRLALAYLDLDNNLEEVSLEHFMVKLENIQIGDDTALAVQNVSRKP